MMSASLAMPLSDRLSPATLLLIGTAGWSLLSTFGRREMREAEGLTLRRRLEHILQAQPLLSLRRDHEGRVHAAFGRAQPGLPHRAVPGHEAAAAES